VFEAYLAGSLPLTSGGGGRAFELAVLKFLEALGRAKRPARKAA
jgi:hypothetical protein